MDNAMQFYGYDGSLWTVTAFNVNHKLAGLPVVKQTSRESVF